MRRSPVLALRASVKIAALAILYGRQPPPSGRT